MGAVAAHRVSLLGVVVLVAACAATLTPQGQAVQPSDEGMVSRCKYLGDVIGHSSDEEAASNDARNRAASLGATNVVLAKETPTPDAWGPPDPLLTVRGHAYQCGTPAASAAPANPPAPAPAAATASAAATATAPASAPVLAPATMPAPAPPSASAPPPAPPAAPATDAGPG